MSEPKQTFKRVTVAGLLDETLSHYRRHLGLFFLIAAVTQLLLAVMSAILSSILLGVMPSLENAEQYSIFSILAGKAPLPESTQGTLSWQETLNWNIIGAGILSLLISWVIELLGEAALVRTAGDSYLGLHPNFFNSYAAAILRLGRLILMALSMAVVLVLQAITIVGIPFAIYFGVRWLFAPQTIVLENAGAWEGLARSYRLVRGNWWRCLGIVILVFLVVVGATIVFSLPFSLIIEGLKAAMPWLKGSPLDLMNSLFSAVVASIIAPAAAIALTVLYADLRAREEASSTPPRDISTPS